MKMHGIYRRIVWLLVGVWMLGGIPSVSAAETETVMLSLPDGKEGLSVYEPDSLAVKVRAVQKNTETADYMLEYYFLDQLLAVSEVQLPPYVTRPFSQTFKNLPQGAGEFRVVLKQGERIAAEAVRRIAVVSPYEPCFMDDVSLKGFSTHYGLENVMDDKATYLLNYAGIKTLRDELNWSKVERTGGGLSSARGDVFIRPYMDGASNNMVLVLNYNNNLYSGKAGLENSTKYGVTTKLEIDGFARYAAFIAQQYPQIRYFEIWNEPNGVNTGFWLPMGVESVEDYTYLLQVTYDAIKKVRPDAQVLGGALAGTDTAFAQGIYAQNGYSFLDGISFHPYIYPKRADAGLEEEIGELADCVRRNGGWKTLAVTEAGWSTYAGEKGCSEQFQAEELVKQFVIGDACQLMANQIYTFRNTGTNQTDREQNFGVVTKDNMPKPAYISVKECIGRLAGALYVGAVTDYPGVKMHIYVKEGQVFAVVWGNGSISTESFAQQIDMMGNSVTEGTEFAISDSPCYLYGLDERFYLPRALRQAMTKRLENILADYGSKLPQDVTQEIQKFQVLPDEIAMSGAAMDALYAAFEELGLFFIRAYRNGETALHEAEAYGALYCLAQCGNAITNAAMAFPIVAETEPDVLVARLQLECEQRQAQETGGRYRYVSAMLNYGGEYLYRAEKANNSSFDSPVKDDVVRGMKRYADTVFQWAEQLLQTEQISSDNLILIAPTGSWVYQSVNNQYVTGVYNHSKQEFRGYVEAGPEKGEAVSGRSERFTLNPGEDKEIPVVFRADAVSQNYIFRLVAEDGAEIASRKVKVTWRTAGGALPYAKAVEITGDRAVGSAMQGNYQWCSPQEGAEETGTQFSWFSSADGIYYSRIEGETSCVFVPDESFDGKWIRFGVTPGGTRYDGKLWQSPPVLVGTGPQVSRITDCGSRIFFDIYADEPKKALGFLAEYGENNILLQCRAVPVSLMRGKNEICFPTESAVKYLKLMLLKNAESLEPLSKSAEIRR